MVQVELAEQQLRAGQTAAGALHATQGDLGQSRLRRGAFSIGASHPAIGGRSERGHRIVPARVAPRSRASRSPLRDWRYAGKDRSKSGCNGGVPYCGGNGSVQCRREGRAGAARARRRGVVPRCRSVSRRCRISPERHRSKKRIRSGHRPARATLIELWSQVRRQASNRTEHCGHLRQW